MGEDEEAAKNARKKAQRKARDRAYYEANKDAAQTRNRAYYEANKDAVQAQKKAWYEANRESIAARRYTRARLIESRFAAAAQNSSRRGHYWSLTLDQYAELVDGKPCSYCGGPLPEAGGGLDRMDSRRGYEIGFVRPCCGPCNVAKGRLPAWLYEIAWSHLIKRYPQLNGHPDPWSDPSISWIKVNWTKSVRRKK